MRIDLNITILRHNLSTNKPVFGPALSVNSLCHCVKFNVAMFTHWFPQKNFQKHCVCFNCFVYFSFMYVKDQEVRELGQREGRGNKLLT